jgi:hypothetical protein
LANSYLGLKDHKFFSQVDEIFQSGASLSSTEISADDCESKLAEPGYKIDQYGVANER